MSYNITLNSSNAITKNTYQYNFKSGGFEIPEGAEMCISQITIPYSWVNVSAALGNNIIGYALPAGTASTSVKYFSITLADGFYDIDKLNTALQNAFKANGHYYSVPSAGGKDTIFYYPIQLQYNTTLYTNQIVYLCFAPATSSGNYKDYAALYGTSTLPGTWSGGGYPADTYWHGGSAMFYASLFIPDTTSNSIGKMLGFTGASSITSPATTNGTFYPSLSIANAFGQGTANNPSVTRIYFATVDGNSSSASPSFVPLGSSVNGVVVRCNLVENKVNSNNDIMDSFPITTTYGSNLNYSPQIENWVKLKPGKHSYLTIYFADDNLNPLQMLDSTVLITLKIKF